MTFISFAFEKNFKQNLEKKKIRCKKKEKKDQKWERWKKKQTKRQR